MASQSPSQPSSTPFQFPTPTATFHNKKTLNLKKHLNPTSSVLFVIFIVINLSTASQAQRTFKDMTRKCQCPPSNWNPMEMENMKKSIKTFEVWGAEVEGLVAGMEGRMEDMVHNISNSFSEIINATSALGKNSIFNLTPSNGGMMSNSSLFGIISSIFGTSNTSNVKAMLESYVLKIDRMEGRMNETWKKLEENKGMMEEVEAKINETDTLKSLLEAQQVEMGVLKKMALTSKCHKPVLALSGEVPLEGVKVTVSSKFGQNESMEIPASSVWVNSSNFWCANEPNLAEEYIEISFNKTTRVLGLVTRGRGNYNQWVSSFRVDLKDGGAGGMWVSMKDEFDVDVKIFRGNEDMNGVLTTHFPHPPSTQFFRFVPLTTPTVASVVSNKCARLDVIVCADEERLL